METYINIKHTLYIAAKYGNNVDLVSYFVDNGKPHFLVDLLDQERHAILRIDGSVCTEIEDIVEWIEEEKQENKIEEDCMNLRKELDALTKEHDITEIKPQVYKILKHDHNKDLDNKVTKLLRECHVLILCDTMEILMGCLKNNNNCMFAPTKLSEGDYLDIEYGKIMLYVTLEDSHYDIILLREDSKQPYPKLTKEEIQQWK